MPSPAWVAEVTPDELDVDPYPVWARMRAEDPVPYVPWAELWFITRWDDCLAVGTDKETWRGATDHPTIERVFGAPNVLTAVDPIHRDLRAAVDPLLRPRSVKAYIEDLARPIVRRHLDRIRDRGQAEIMGDFFEPVSVEALGELMGLGVDGDTLRRWFHGLNVGISNMESDPAKFAVSDAITAEIETLLEPLLERLRREPDDSMLSNMVHGGREGGDARTAHDVFPSLKVILLGGMQEPGHAAGSSLLGLLGRPDQLARVVADPDLVPKAVTEGLRWIAPIGAVERQATVDTVVGGVEMPAGSIVELILGSANRDEQRFDRPDEFDLDRRQSHMAFGNGQHFCSGHFFSRQLERIALEELLPALPGLRLDPDGEVKVRGWVFRAPKHMPVLWDA